MPYIVFAFVIFIILISVIIIIMNIEMVISSVFNKKIPPVPSGDKMRNAVIGEIVKNYPNVKSIIDIGSGWGGFVRKIAKDIPGAKVTGVEVVHSPYIVSKITQIIFGPKNCEFVRKNAFEYIKDKKFDMAVCYLSTMNMKEFESYRDRFKIVIAIDFEFSNIKPSRVIKIHKDIMGDHSIYIYEN